MKEIRRCDWRFDAMRPELAEKYKIYHDTRWGKPVHEDQELFAMLILEGAQAGLSWATILMKEEAYRKAFDDFDPVKVAAYDESKLEELQNNPGIIRNKNKISSAVSNAKAFLEIQKEWGSFDVYIWHFTEGNIIDHHLERAEDMPARDELSEKVSKDLKKRGFKFVGPTIIYSYLQGIGVINDHVVSCEYR